jgi:hypothetical protein
MANEFKVKKGLIVDGTNTVLDIQGTQGQLFSVTDSLTGDLFSVSDVSGVPILNVNSSGLSTFDGSVGIGLTSTTANLEVKSIQDSSFDEGIGVVRSNTSQTGYINMVGGAMNINAPNAIPIKFRDGGNTNLTIGGDGHATFGGDVRADNIGLGSDATSFGTGVPTLLFKGTNSSNGRAGALYFKENDGTDTAALYVTDGNDGYGTVLTAYQGSLKLATGSLTSTVLTLDQSNNATFAGKVGAGLSPSTTLHVSGSSLSNNVAALIGGGWVGNDSYHKEGGLLLISGTNTSQTGAGIAFQTRNTQDTNYWKSSIIMDRDGALRFTLGGAGTGAGSNDFTILSNGNATFAGRVKGVNYTSTENAAPGGFQASRDYLIAGTGDRGGGLVINDISGARHALYAGGHDLTFAKETDNGAGTVSHDIWMRASASNSAGNVDTIDLLKNTVITGSISATTASFSEGVTISDILDGPFTALRLMNQKSYGSGTGTNEKVRFVMGLSEANIAFSGREGFVIELGIANESDSSNGIVDFKVRDGGLLETYSTVTGSDKSVSFVGNLTVGSGNEVSIVSSGSSHFPSLKVNNNGYLGSASVTTQIQLLSSGDTSFFGDINLSNDSRIVHSNRNLYAGSSTSTQYLKIFDRGSNTGSTENYLHFSLRSYNNSEFSAEVKIMVPTYSGFTTSYGTMDEGQGVQVEIITGGLTNQSMIFDSIIECADLSSTTSSVALYLKITPPVTNTVITLKDYADADVTVDATTGSWSTTAPSNQQREFTFVNGATVVNEVLSVHRNQSIGIQDNDPDGKLSIKYDMDVNTGGTTTLSSSKTQYGSINFKGVATQASGSTGTTMQGLTWHVNNYGNPVVDYGVQAQLVVGNNGSIGTFMGMFTSNNYSNAPVERLRITEDGDVLIGTDSTHHNYGGKTLCIGGTRGTLSLKSTGSLSTIAMHANNDTSKDVHINHDGTTGGINFFQYSNGGVSSLKLSGSGQLAVNLGNSSPSRKLHVVGGALFSSNSSTATSRSTTGVGITFTNNNTFSSNSDLTDANRFLSITNDSSTSGAYAPISFRVNPAGSGFDTAMADIKLVANGNNHHLTTSFRNPATDTFLDVLSLKAEGGIDLQGSAGQLFSVTNSLTGDLFSVSDVSGVPILNVNSSGLVEIDNDLKISGPQAEIHNLGNDTTAKLVLSGHNNTGTPGVKTSGTIEHRGEHLKTVITHNGSDVLTIGTGTQTTLAGTLTLNGLASATQYLKQESHGDLYVQTTHGYFKAGPGNGSYCHVTTDRGRFYMNKRLVVDDGIFASYDEDLKLYRADNAAHSMTLSTTAATFTHDVVAYSDNKLKENVKTLDGSKVLSMRGVSFDRKDTGLPSSGVIAQEIQKVAPELVSESNGTLGVSYGNLVGYLIEAVKDQQKQIDELKKIIKNGNNL